jgi:formyltetrahydrofolate synthetase
LNKKLAGIRELSFDSAFRIKKGETAEAWPQIKRMKEINLYLSGHINYTKKVNN